MGGQATADWSMAHGQFTQSTGTRSLALGYGLLAKSGQETVLGTYNTDYSPASATGWNAADRLLVVGNGEIFNRSDAVVVKKNGRTGIGSADTKAQLHVSGNDGLLVTGTLGTGEKVDSSVFLNGVKMFFYPSRGAFRSGQVTGTQWNHTRIGFHSFAVGYNTVASGHRSVAMGHDVVAPSNNEVALGIWNTEYTPAGNTNDRAFSIGIGTGSGAFRSDALVILKSGNVGVGVSAPTTKLHIYGGNWNLATTDGDLLIGSGSHKFKVSMSTGGAGAGIARINSMSSGTAQSVRIGTAGNDVLTVRGNNVGIGNTNPAYQLELSTNSAGKPTSSAWTVTSDERLKMNVRPFTDGLALVEAIEPVWFTYNGKAGMPEESGVGTIAQQLQRVAPYMVNQWTYRDEAGREEQYLAVDYGAMDFVLVNAVKELKAQLEDRDRRLAELEVLVNSLISARK